MFERGVRIPALMSWVSVSYRGSDTRVPHSVSLWECAVLIPLGRASLLSTCVLWCFTQFVLSAACIHVMSCAVWHAACVFHWLRAFMLSCLVWTRGLWVSSLAACSCLVLHMAGDLFAGHVLVFLCKHMASVLVFCVPCALMSIVLTPLILLPDLPHLSSLVTLLICSLYNLLVFAVLCQFITISPSHVSYHVLSSPAQPSPAQPCPAQPCPAQPSPAQPCPALPSPALPSPALPSPALPSPALPCPALPSPALPCPALPSPALPCPALPCPAQPCPALPSPALPSPALPCPAQPCPALPCPAQPSPAQPSPAQFWITFFFTMIFS